MGQATISDGFSAAPSLPLAIRRFLARVDGRLRAASAMRGLGLVSALGALGAALGMGADFAWDLPPGVRWAAWGAWLVSTLLALAWRVVRPLARVRRWLDLAALTERVEPALGERLSAVVGLLGRPGPEPGPRSGPPRGSPALIAALAEDAAAAAAAVDPAHVVPLRGAAWRLGAGLLALGLLAAPGFAWPGSFGLLAHRFVAPWAALDRVSRWVLAVEPGDAVAGLGADFRVTARVRPRFGTPPAAGTACWLELVGDEADRRAPRPSRRVAMTPAAGEPPGPPAFEATLSRLAGPMAYRVVCGPASSRTFRVRVVEPPAVARVEAWVEPPPYTGTAAGPSADAARIEAWQASRVRLRVTASRPVRSVSIGWPGSGTPVAARLEAGGRSALAWLEARASGPYTLTLRDADGLSSRAEAPRRVVVRPDAPPVLAVDAPEAPVEAGPDDALPVALAARDDLAVASVELHYALERAGPAAEGQGHAHSVPVAGRLAVPVSGLGTPSARGAVELALGPLGARPGDVLRYRVRVADNRPGPLGPNVVWSAGKSLPIADGAEPLGSRRDRDDRQALQERLDALKADAAENREETEQLRYAADAALRGNGEWDRARQQALGQREASARDVADRIQLLARDLAATASFRGLAASARQVAEADAEPGRALLERARGRSDDVGRLDDLRQADARLAAVSSGLDDLQRRFDEQAGRAAERQELRSLAGREEALARRAGDAKPAPSSDDRDRPQLQADQAAVQGDLDALLERSPRLRASSPEPLAEARAAMREAARALGRPGEDGREASRRALSRAARDLRDAASQSERTEPGAGAVARADRRQPAPGASANSGRDPGNAQARPGTADLAAIQALVRSQSGRAWGELPGHLRTQILQMAQGRYRDDYARLIQLYFQEIATGAVGNEPPRP